MSNTNCNINNCLTTDVVIIGGGIAGLMLQNKVNQLGYSSLLLEQDSLGSGQTSKSQGIIHGGIKYALLGQITEAAKAISKMPKLWSEYLNNTGELNLNKTKVLSQHHLLWNNGDIKNKLKQIVMQKTLSSSGEALAKSNYPDVLKHPDFTGSVYKINETVIDVFSLLENLSEPNKDKIIKIDYDSLNIILNAKKEINNLTFCQNKKVFNIVAKKYIFTAGQDNQMIIDLLPNLPKMQLRPLHMVMAKFPEPNILYGHYVGNGILPQLTISTHFCKDGSYIWYIGGKIAETGLYLNSEQQTLQAKVEINNIFPWLDTRHWQWSSLKVTRAEPLQPHNTKPDEALIAHHNNAMVAWPTKLALTPLMVEEVIKHLDLEATYSQCNIKDYSLATAPIAKPFFETTFSEQFEALC